MTNINKLSSMDTVTGSDLLAFWSSANSDSRKATASVLLAYMQANLDFTASNTTQTTQHAAPSATGFSVTVLKVNSWLILTPSATYATGTIILPTAPTDGNEVLVNCTQAVTALTVDGGTKTVTGEPASLAANDFFRLRYDGVTSVWYRVG